MVICQLRSYTIRKILLCLLTFGMLLNFAFLSLKHIMKYTHVLFVFAAEVTEKRLRNAIDEIIQHNNYVDRDYEHDASWHFNGEQIREGNIYFI